jgi:Transposase domain (DUF772)
MRGPDEQTAGLFSYLSPEARVRANHPLRAIRLMTDQVLRELSPRFDRMYSDMGRPSIPPEQLLRALLLQGLYTIRSERLLIEEIDYAFCFIGSSRQPRWTGGQRLYNGSDGHGEWEAALLMLGRAQATTVGGDKHSMSTGL